MQDSSGWWAMAKHDLRQVKPVSPSDAWVHKSPDTAPTASSTEKMKRLTIDVPLSLHTRLKTECAATGLKIADVVRELITQHLLKKK
jgi:hypothetical protein